MITGALIVAQDKRPIRQKSVTKKRLVNRSIMLSPKGGKPFTLRYLWSQGNEGQNKPHKICNYQSVEDP